MAPVEGRKADTLEVNLLLGDLLDVAALTGLMELAAGEGCVRRTYG